MQPVRTDTDIAVGDHRDLLDIIDNLRLQGVSHYVDLPEIIVCGDQSAGKSSVLEAISGIPFPIKDGLCTRFATELVLRRGRDVNINVSITPGESRFGEEKERLEGWRPKASIDKEGLGTVTDEAMTAIAYPTGTGEFYDDILRIEVTGPIQPHLTMVDLPGLFRRGNKEQADTDIDIVRGMVEKYMARPRSIILTVVSAKYEYVLQEVTLMAKRADPEGLRTMGLITKPDTLDVGSPSETYFVRLAQNLEAELRLGWHVLKNRNFEERDVTSARRDEIEKEFFSQGLWDSIDSSHCGVAALRVRLSTILKDQILAQLPSLVQEVEAGVCDCAERLDRLGPERDTTQQQQNYLLLVSEEYTSLMRQAVEGTYTNPFFGNRKKLDKFSTRLRAVVQIRLREFAAEMRLNGQSQHIVDSGSEDEGAREIRDVPRISRSDFIDDVANRLQYSKGRELPGLFNPLIVSDLFVEQSTPWRRIVGDLSEDVLEAAHLTTQLIVEHVTARDASEGVLRLLRQKIEGLKVEMDSQIDTLLVSAAQHPITYNSQLTENVQRIQQDRHKRSIKTLICSMFGSHRFDGSDSKISINPIELVNLAGTGFEPDMERFGSALAVDYMKAYHKLAVDRFIDDVSNLAIEDCLISKLSSLFRSSTVMEINGQDLYRLAGETQESCLERKRLEVKRRILTQGLRDLKSLYRRSNVINSPKQDELASEDSEQMPAMAQSRFEQASTATTSAEAAPEVISPDEPSVLLPTDKWKLPSQGEPQGDMNDIWIADIPNVPKKSKKKVGKAGKASIMMNPFEEQGWGH